MKVYKIKINIDVPRTPIWYSDKPGQCYTTKLTYLPWADTHVYQVVHAPYLHVHPQHCTVVEEK